MPIEPGASDGPANAVEELDLTAEPEADVPPATPRSVPVEVQIAQEGWRGRLAVGLLLLIALIVVAAFASVALGWARGSALKDLLALVFTPLVGLFGAVIGFYFGTKGTGETVEIRPKSAKPKSTKT